MSSVEHIKPCNCIENNWQDESVYDYTHGFNGAQWAWQFLRRNPVYQQQWQDFIQVWRALEADYGKAPDRDFCRWKLDCRAWELVDPDAPDQGCRIDEDKVLIECVFGSRWGFYKFPCDPTINDPIADDQLSWRPQDVDVALEHLIEQDKSAHIDLSFDLSLPLKNQMEKAKKALAIKRRDGIKQGLFIEKRVSNYCADWLRYIRLLDAGAVAASDDELSLFFSVDSLENDKAKAKQLVAEGYLSLVAYPK